MQLRLLLPTLFLLAGSASAQTSYPMLTHVVPVAVQRGKTAEVTVSGQMNLGGVYKALFDGDGLSAEGLPLGLQLIGRPFEEETLFALAHVMEQAAGRFSPQRWW